MTHREKASNSSVAFLRFIGSPKADPFYWEKARYISSKTPAHEGSMSLIYKAFDSREGKPVAIKILQPFIDDEEHKQLIKKEAEVINSIRHPSVPFVYDVLSVESPDGPTTAMIMEYIEEKTLEQRLKSGPPLSPREAIDVVRQTGAFIDFLDLSSGHTLFNGDLKPSHIFLTYPNIRIIDFASSTLANEKGEEYDPNFSAPERRFRFGQEIVRNAASEEFSLAAIAYYIITGHTIDINDRKKTTFKKLSKWNVRYDFSEYEINKLNQVFTKALAFDPKERFPSSSQFADEFSIVMQSAKTKKTLLNLKTVFNF